MSPGLVDAFEHGDWFVRVYFEDPLLQIAKRDPEFASRPSGEQVEALSDYLHQNVVYRVFVSDEDGEMVGGLVLEGDPAVTESASFYRAVTYKTTGRHPDWGKRTRIAVRGMLFEHMAPFQIPGGKRHVGNGVALFDGAFMRVMPYAEVKAALLPLLDEVTVTR